MRFLFLLTFLTNALAGRSVGVEIARIIPAECRQLVVVTAADWSASRGELHCLSRKGSEGWQAAGVKCEVLLGENGLGWGDGLLAVPAQAGRVKREGDRCSPAGAFLLPSAFGNEAREAGLPYRQIVAGVEAVDDPNSRYYNRILQRSKIARPDWRSSERMAAVPDYALGIVVAHNPRNTPGAGSCIFIHLWRGERAGTAGCTALREADLKALVRWLDVRMHPVLVQLPRSEIPAGFP